MARLRRLLNLIVIAIGTIIVWNERRNPARSGPLGSARVTDAASSPSMEADTPNQVAFDQASAPAGDRASDGGPSPDVAPAPNSSDELVERQNVAAEARFTSGPPTAIGDETAAPDASAAAPSDVETAPELTVADAANAAPTSARHVDPNSSAVPAGAVAGDGSATCPPDHPIKGNAGSMIYHLPGQPSYDRTVAEFCFASEQDAEAAGYRAPKR